MDCGKEHHHLAELIFFNTPVVSACLIA